MKNMAITKEITFDTAHRLTFHKGLCKNVHGHTYRLQVTLKEEEGEFIDFADLKKDLMKVKEYYDHAIVLLMCPENQELIDTLLKMEMNVIIYLVEPTAENMIEHICKVLLKGLPLKRVRLYETPTSYAEVIL